MKHIQLFEKFDANSLLHASTEAKMRHGEDGPFKNASGKGRNPGPTFQGIVIDGLAELGWEVTKWDNCVITAEKKVDGVTKVKSVQFKDAKYRNANHIFSKFK